MKALQIDQVKSWKRIDIPEPREPGPGEAVVKVHRVGVCGTDVGCYLGRFPYFAFPRIPGHELGVEVLAVGAGVTNIAVGDRCCVEPYINCGRCDSCRRGHTNCCEHNQTFGVMCDGGLTEQVILPANKLHPVGTLSYDQAALVETLAIGCHAVNRAAPMPAENVLILGAGPIGLSVLEFARIADANVILADINESRLAFARERLGIANTVLLDGTAADLEAVQRCGGGRMADVVIDATGNNHSMVRSFEFTAFCARVVFVGITSKEIAFLQSPIFHRRELTLLASRNALPNEFRQIIQFIEEGRIDTQPWMTHRATLDQVPDVFDSWIEPSSGVIKAIIAVT